MDTPASSRLVQAGSVEDSDGASGLPPRGEEPRRWAALCTLCTHCRVGGSSEITNQSQGVQRCPKDKVRLRSPEEEGLTCFPPCGTGLFFSVKRRTAKPKPPPRPLCASPPWKNFLRLCTTHVIDI